MFEDVFGSPIDTTTRPRMLRARCRQRRRDKRRSPVTWAKRQQSEVLRTRRSNGLNSRF
jgi:hypothetical protein